MWTSSNSTDGINNYIEVLESVPLKSSDYAKNDIVHFVRKFNISDVDQKVLLEELGRPYPPTNVTFMIK